MQLILPKLLIPLLLALNRSGAQPHFAMDLAEVPASEMSERFGFGFVTAGELFLVLRGSGSIVRSFPRIP